MSGRGHAARLGARREVELNLTTRCTLACGYCPQVGGRARTMGSGMVAKVLEGIEVLDRGPLGISFTGGEPLLEAGLLRLAVERLEARLGRDRLQLTLLTNGTLLDDGMLGFLDAHGFRVQLSVDGGPAAQELRAPGSIEGVAELLGRMRRRHPRMQRERVRAAMVVTSANAGMLADSVSWIVEQGVAEIWCGPVLTHDPGWRPELEAVLDRQLAEIAALCARHARRGLPAPFAPFRRRPGEDPGRDPDAPLCRAASPETFAVGPDGEVAGCSALLDLARPAARSFVERDLEPLRPGRFGEPGLAERIAAMGERMAEAGFPPRAEERYSGRRRCADCEHLHSCRVCPVAAGAIPGNRDPRRVPDLACAFMDLVLTHRARVPPLPSVADLLRGAGELPSERRAVAERRG